MSSNPPVNKLTAALKKDGPIVSRPMKGSPMMGLFALAALGTTAWMIRDSYHGNKEREEQEASMHQANKDYAYSAYDWGRYSGRPHMDNLAHSWMGLKLYGPYGLKELYQETVVKVYSIYKEVILPNLVPIGISIASLYGFFGAKSINSKFGYVGKKIGGVISRANVGGGFCHYANKAYEGTVNGAAKVLEKAFTHPAVAAGTVLLGAWFLKSFNDAYSGQGQREYFRHELWQKDGMEE